ncbi:MAG TPA: TonB-dependent receptor [Candidatus Baltobacteraceae bacterium]
MLRRFLAGILTAAIFAAVAPLGALAQSDTGEIDIAVTDVATKAPVVLARVLLDGPVVASEFTGDNGKVRFTNVPNGIYRARVAARGYQVVTSSNFEVIDGRVVGVDVALALSTQLKVIGSVEAHSSATISTSTIDAASAQRKLSDTLAQALGKLSGVTVDTSSGDSDATQTISLEGQDPTQTALSLDGIPLNAPGTAGDLKAIGSDLFSGSSVRFGPQAGGLAGGVNFQTLEPTITWQSAFTLSAGSNGKNNYSAAESGSFGKLGVAAMHTYRATPSLLDGMFYRDASGLAYDHQGDQNSTGNLLKLRYQLNDAQTLTGMVLSSSNGSESVCTQFTGLLPCGSGPNNFHDSRYDLYSLTDNALLGETQIQAAFFGTASRTTNDLLNRFVDGVAAPTGTTSDRRSSGFSVNATLPARDRHTISINAYSTNTTTHFTPLVPQARPFLGADQRASYGAITVSDSIRSNTKLRFNESIGLSHASNAAGSLLAGISTQWQPTAADTYSLSYNVGGTAAHAGRQGALTDPQSLTFDCNGDVAYGRAPGDPPGASSSISTRLSYSHKSRAGLISTSLYRQVQNDVVLPTEVNGSALVGYGIFPPTYFAAAGGIFNSPAGCGATPQRAFGPQNVYFSTPIGGVRRVYEGAQISGFFTLGNLVVEPFYNIQVAKALSSDPRFTNPYAITIPGAQVPNVPLHRAGITLDYKAPHSALEYLADANYTGSNNGQNLPAYTTVDAGVSANLTHGSLTFAASNIFNAYGGIFAGGKDAVPYTTANGISIPTVARPNAPRQYAVTYTVKFGSGVTQTNARAVSAVGDRGPGGGRRGGGFRDLAKPLPTAPPSDPFAVGGAQCSAQARAQATPILDGLKASVAAIEAAKTPAGYPDTFALPAIPGVSVTYRGMKTTYALAIALRDRGALRGLFACSQFHVAQADVAAQRGLYVTPSTGGGPFSVPTVNFMPEVGLYFVRAAPQAGAESYRVYALPTAAPATPFALRTATTCSAAMKQRSALLLGELQRHFAANAATPDWTIAAHSAPSGTWYSLDAADVSALPGIINCARVAAATKENLAKIGWDGSAPPSLNYAKALGLYFVSPQRRTPPGSPSASP